MSWKNETSACTDLTCHKINFCNILEFVISNRHLWSILFDLLTVSVKYCSSSFEKRTQIFLTRFKMLAPEQQNISRFDGFWTAWPARFYVVHYLNIRQDQMVVNHKNTEGPSLALLCVADICGALCTSFFLSKCNPGLKKTILRDWLAMLKLNLNVLSRRSTVQYFMMTSWSDTSPVKHTFF